MAEDISLKIFTPEKTALNKKVHRVVLPYGRTNLTLIDERAPTSLLLNKGVLQILDNDNHVVSTYFIDGGVVDVADNICKISTLHLLAETAITAEKAAVIKENEPQNAEYYQMIIDYFKTKE